MQAIPKIKKYLLTTSPHRHSWKISQENLVSLFFHSQASVHRSRRITASCIRLQSASNGHPEPRIASHYSDSGGRVVPGAESPAKNKLKRSCPPPNVKQSINGTPQWPAPQPRNARNRRAPPAVELPSRIPTTPMVAQNFNQISKTASNLLNDIYERHLLNQTTFDGATATSGSAAPTTTITGNGANWKTMRIESDFNFNNLCYEPPPLPPSATTMAQPNNFQANSAIPMHRPPLNSGQPKSQPHKITKNCRMPRRSAAPSMIMVDDSGGVGGEDSGSASHERNERVYDNNGRTFHQQTFSSKWNNANDDKMHGRKASTSYMSTATAAAGNQENVPLYEKIERTYAPHPNIIKSNIFYDASDYGGGPGHRKPFGKYGVGMEGAMRYEPTGETFYNKASTPMALLSSTIGGTANGIVGVGGDGGGGAGLKTAAKNFEYTNNSKINFMLETAQAVAAAAYFARFVCCSTLI